MSRHKIWPEGPLCSPHCEGDWSQWHDGYAAGYEDALKRLEQDDRDEEAEREFLKPINPDPVTRIAKDAKKNGKT